MCYKTSNIKSWLSFFDLPISFASLIDQSFLYLSLPSTIFVSLFFLLLLLSIYIKIQNNSYTILLFSIFLNEILNFDPEINSLFTVGGKCLKWAGFTVFWLVEFISAKVFKKSAFNSGINECELVRSQKIKIFALIFEKNCNHMQLLQQQHLPR